MAKVNGVVINACDKKKFTYEGFSWCYLFFSDLYALYKGFWMFAILGFLTRLVLAIFFGYGALLVIVLFAFIFHDQYNSRLMKKGWKVFKTKEELEKKCF